MTVTIEQLAAKVAARPAVDSHARRHERHVLSDGLVLDIVTYVDPPTPGEAPAHDEVEIWLNGEECDFDGPIIGMGETREAAAADAIAGLEKGIAVITEWRS